MDIALLDTDILSELLKQRERQAARDAVLPLARAIRDFGFLPL